MIKVVLAENRKIMREGIRLILEKDTDLCVIGAAASLENAFLLCEREKPDILLMNAELTEGMTSDRDWRMMPHPNTKTILLSNTHDEEKIAWGIQRGATGSVCWEIDPTELVMTVKIVAMGLSVIQGHTLQSIVRSLNGTTDSSPSLDKPEVTYPLTKRETEVIREIKLGKENREIARSLYLSEGTVKNTISSILKKLNLKTRVQLAIFAVEHDIGA
ncbi:response regulator transcription factor [Gorillibacterium timonense]|uniref:response regulator transcription factor n=1 Tax=Gorillibacterium timonense TaxID=1689269 RepID=UPI00071D03D7|nr:response regulator transcription factor [Gorillibacterium timonense]